MATLPSYYDAKDVGKVLLERASEVAAEATRYRHEEKLRDADEDRFRIAALGIDCQLGFCSPAGSLFVPGAVEDSRRAVEWIYRNLETITALHFSLDTHRVFQIFHPAWWRDAEGLPPAPLTPIRAEDVRSGRYRAVMAAAESLEYCERLEAGGKLVLTIWPYHTLLGGVSHALEPALMEAALLHSLVRQAPTHFTSKGEAPETENYSILSPEVCQLGGRTVGRFDEELFARLVDFDRVYVFGQAKSHCVLATLDDLRHRAEGTDPALLSKIWILEDAMSPVPAPPLDPLPAELDFPTLAEAAFARLEEAGMRRCTTAEEIIIP